MYLDELTLPHQTSISETLAHNSGAVDIFLFLFGVLTETQPASCSVYGKDRAASNGYRDQDRCLFPQ